MMRRGEWWSAAVRRADGSIATIRATAPPTLPRLATVPVLRGLNALVDSLRIGLRAMAWSREQAESRASTAGERFVVGFVVVAVVTAFLWIPLLVAAPVASHLGPLAGSLTEGVVRLGLFVAYLAAISSMPGIRRTLEYHGAEHMVIAASEHAEHDGPASEARGHVDGSREPGERLNVVAARRHDVRHPRCGTDFFFLMFAMAILVFAAVGDLPLLWLGVSRLVLGPLVVGVSYEVLRWSGVRGDSAFGRWLAAPGLALQRFTTRQPDDSQIEVALSAFHALDTDNATTIPTCSTP